MMGENSTRNMYTANAVKKEIKNTVYVVHLVGLELNIYVPVKCLVNTAWDINKWYYNTAKHDSFFVFKSHITS
jgi:hypothetical protein